MGMHSLEDYFVFLLSTYFWDSGIATCSVLSNLFRIEWDLGREEGLQVFLKSGEGKNDKDIFRVRKVYFISSISHICWEIILYSTIKDLEVCFYIFSSENLSEDISVECVFVFILVLSCSH